MVNGSQPVQVKKLYKQISLYFSDLYAGVDQFCGQLCVLHFLSHGCIRCGLDLHNLLGCLERGNRRGIYLHALFYYGGFAIVRRHLVASNVHDVGLDFDDENHDHREMEGLCGNEDCH